MSERSGRWPRTFFMILGTYSKWAFFYFSLAQRILLLFFQCHTVTHGRDLRISPHLKDILLKIISNKHNWSRICKMDRDLKLCGLRGTIGLNLVTEAHFQELGCHLLFDCHCHTFLDILQRRRNKYCLVKRSLFERQTQHNRHWLTDHSWVELAAGTVISEIKVYLFC